MGPINYPAIAVATVAALIFSALYYFLLHRKITALRETYVNDYEAARTKMTFNKLIVEFTRTFIVGLAMAYAVINAQNIIQAAVVVIWLWVAFPVVLLIGAVMHERFPASLAVIHAFDWLVKLMIFAVILTFWR